MSRYLYMHEYKVEVVMLCTNRIQRLLPIAHDGDVQHVHACLWSCRLAIFWLMGLSSARRIFSWSLFLTIPSSFLLNAGKVSSGRIVKIRCIIACASATSPIMSRRKSMIWAGLCIWISMIKIISVCSLQLYIWFRDAPCAWLIEPLSTLKFCAETQSLIFRDTMKGNS